MCGAESTNDDLIDWRRLALVTKELNVDREKLTLYTIKKRMRAVAGQPAAKDRTRRSAYVCHCASLFAKYEAGKKVLFAGSQAATIDGITMGNLGQEPTKVGGIEVHWDVELLMRLKTMNLSANSYCARHWAQSTHEGFRSIGDFFTHSARENCRWSKAKDHGKRVLRQRQRGGGLFSVGMLYRDFKVGKRLLASP
jgi:hypothetical protein